MTSSQAPPRPRGWPDAIREAALRFNVRLSQPAFGRLAGKATPPAAPLARPGLRVPVGPRRKTG